MEIEMKKRIFASLLLVMMLLSSLFCMVSCGDDEIRGITLSVYDSGINYDPESNRSNIQATASVTNQNGDRMVNRFTYKVYCYDAYGNVMAVREGSYENTIYPHVTTQLYVNDVSVSGEVSRISIVPASMVLGENAESATSEEDGPVFTKISTWGFGAWFWVIVAAIFIFSAIGNIIGSITEFYDWGDIDSEEGWGMLIGGIVSAAIAITILVILF